MFESEIDCITCAARYSVTQREVHSEYKIRLKESETLIKRDIRGIREARYLTCVETRRGLQIELKKEEKLHRALD